MRVVSMGSTPLLMRTAATQPVEVNRRAHAEGPTSWQAPTSRAARRAERTAL